MTVKQKHRAIDTLELLTKLIRIASYSGEEELAADFLERYLQDLHVKTHRKYNNIWAMPQHWKKEHSNILLNGHIDTVEPSANWTLDPHQPLQKANKLYGLGSNDAGASLVCLLDTFLHFYDKELPVNLIFSATAEEETGGEQGIGSLLDELPLISLGVIGEPTDMQMAAGERGLLVIDGSVKGTTMHAALENPDNAILNALQILRKLQQISFEKESAMLGKVHVTVSQIQAGSQHNVTPAECTFVLDIRLNEFYKPEEVLQILRESLSCSLKARSLDKKASGIPLDHTVVKSAQRLNITIYGSATLSNMAYVPFDCVKIGPGKSQRSHQPDEFIEKRELNEGSIQYKELINQYIALL